MGKGALKFGGKSGILPKTRDIFRRPVRPLKNWEQVIEDSKESGYAEGVPTPVIKGVPLPRQTPARKYITVEEKIKEIKYPSMTLKEMNELPDVERDEQRRAYYRAEFLKEAYLEEEKRLKAIDEIKEKIHMQNLERQRRFDAEIAAGSSEVSSLPTIQKILESNMIRPRTAEEKELIKQQRNLNRNAKELQDKEEKAQKLLELYHEAGKYITNEAQLEDAIHKAFELDEGAFASSVMTVDNKISGVRKDDGISRINESVIADVILGEIDRKPGLNQVKDALNGTREQVRREAQANFHD